MADRHSSCLAAEEGRRATRESRDSPLLRRGKFLFIKFAGGAREENIGDREEGKGGMKENKGGGGS